MVISSGQRGLGNKGWQPSVVAAGVHALDGDPPRSLVGDARTTELGSIAQPPSSTADTSADIGGRVDQTAGMSVFIELFQLHVEIRVGAAR
jgi:hypothetical protein